ncbi:MAG: hypothetical protein FWG34_02320 [Oscillospiraceae bacterium]|nr:hypothetical protein [Oscillospiraceae bacterium]
MKKYLKQISGIFFLFFVFAFLLVSCDSGGSPNGQNAPGDKKSGLENQNSRDDFESAEIPEKIAYEVPEMDCGGYGFTVLAKEPYLEIYWITADMYAEAENGDPINDAVYKRNRILEEKFNIDIKQTIVSDIWGYIPKIVKSGSDDFDVCYPVMQQAGSLVQSGYLLNLYEVPWLDFEKPWWDQSINDSITIGHKLYGAAGNIVTLTNDATWTVLFNKNLSKDFEIGDHYQLVKDGKWTLDVLHENSRKAAKDLDGDGTMTDLDQWGAITQHECVYCLFAGTGQKVIEKSKDDLPVLELNNDRTVSVLDKIIDFMSDGDAQIKADDAEYTKKYANVWNEITTKIFAENRALYEIVNFNMVQTLRNMETDFGILPLPKYDESQNGYYSTLQYGNASVMCIPATASNPERTGAVLEAWAAESVNTLTKAYYEITLKSKNARDEESEAMLDLIFSTRVIDQGLFFNWVGMLDFFSGFSQKKNVDFASQYEKSESKWIAAIEKTIAAMEENN